MPEYFYSLAETLIKSMPNLLTALLILIISYYAGVLVGRLLRRVLERHHAEPGVTHLLSRTVKWTIIIFGFIAALQRFFNVTAFLTGLGIIGFTIGFALQNIMQNFVSGVILLVQQPFRVGHVVGIAGYEGSVLKVGLRTTEMKTHDGRIVFLPNADVLSQPIINYTRAQLRRVELPMSVAHSANLEKARQIILKEIKTVTGYTDDPAPLVLFHAFGASSIDLNIFFWVDTSLTPPPLALDSALIKIKRAFEKAKIEIASPVPTPISYAKKK